MLKEKFNNITEKKSLKQRLSELSITHIVLISLLIIICFIPIVWSWILVFKCNKDIDYAIFEFIALFFIFGIIFPVFSNIIYIVFKHNFDYNECYNQ